MTQKTITQRSRNLAAEKNLENLHPVLRRVYCARGIKDNNDLDRELNGLIPFHDLLNIEKATELLIDTIKNNKKIIIIGDFDADGATSTSVAVIALKLLGAKQVNYLVPNRFTYGYGLTPEIVQVAHDQFSPDLIITVDNGIASTEGVTLAKQLGMRVLITDHHLAPAVLPNADVIINPNQPGCHFASKNIAGVGVIFYVMLAVRRALTDENYFSENNIDNPSMVQLLDLVALGTIADVVPLDKNNRILVHQGLRRIRHGFARPGINALLTVAKRQADKLNAMDLAFALGPRLNAAGRLDDMSLGIACLLATDEAAALRMATELDQLNNERKLIESDMQQQAFASLQRLHFNENTLPAGMCLYDSSWHQGVIGILASRVKDVYYRPVIAFAKADDNYIKGSARSIPGVHIRDVLASIATRYPHLISKFGGHAMAAGLSIAEKDFNEFARVFDEQIQALNVSVGKVELMSDGELADKQIDLHLAQMLQEAGPWGQQFPEPLFEGRYHLIKQKIVAEKHLKCQLKSLHSDQHFEAIAFNVDLASWPNDQAEVVNVCYRLAVNEFRGVRSVQFMIEHLALPHQQFPV